MAKEVVFLELYVCVYFFSEETITRIYIQTAKQI